MVILGCKLCEFTTKEEFSEKAQKHDIDLERRKKISGTTALSMHIILHHKISIKEYVILTEYNAVTPICICGFCSEEPYFNRGKFTLYASGHKEFKWKEEKYIELYGKPTWEHCKNIVGFHRGKPRKFCDTGCSVYSDTIVTGNGHGFSDPRVQEKIRQNNLIKYGVEFISQVPEVANKISATKTGAIYGPLSQEHRDNIGKASSIRWKDPVYREKTTKSLQIAFSMKSEERLNALFNSNKNRLSKLHLHIKEYLKLETLGFISEQRILRYTVDELYEDKKLIIEINGNYIHANPKKFASEDIIRLPGNSYSAEEKWKSDAAKIHKLEQLGYKVFIIWESDNLEEKKQELRAIIEST